MNSLLLLALSASVLTFTFFLSDAGRTELAVAYGVGFGGWAALCLALAAGRWARGTRPLVPVGPWALFLVALAIAITVAALNRIDQKASLALGQPILVPRSPTTDDPTAFYLAMEFLAVALVVFWGQARGRALETAIALQVAFATVGYWQLWRFVGIEVSPETTAAPLQWAGTLGVGLLFLRQARERGLPRRFGPLEVVLLLLLGAGVLSTVTASYVHQSLSNLITLGSYLLLAWLMASSDATSDDSTLYVYLTAMLTPALGVALTDAVDVGGRALELGASFALTHTETFDPMAFRSSTGIELTGAALLALGTVFVAHSWWVRSAGVALAAFFLLSVGVTYSIPSLAGLALGALVMLALLPGRRLFLGFSRRGMVVWVGAGAVVAVLLALLFTVGRPVANAYASTADDPTTGTGPRGFLLGLAGNDIRANPWTGVGLGVSDERAVHVGPFRHREATALAEVRYLLGDATRWRELVFSPPHISTLAVAEDMGLLGLAAFLGVIAGFLWILWRSWRRAQGAGRALAVVWTALFAALFLWSSLELGEHPAPVVPTLFLTLGLALLAARVGSKKSRAGSAEFPALWRPGWGLTAALLALAALAVLGAVARPVAAEAFAQRGRAAATEGDYALAEARATLAHRLDPWNARYQREQGFYALYAGDTDQAISALERVAELRSASAAEWVNLGDALWLGGEVEAALTAYERAAALDPWDATGSDPQQVLALALLRLGRFDEAADWLTIALELEPTSLGEQPWRPFPGQDGLDWTVDPAYLPGAPAEALEARLRQRLGFPDSSVATFPPVAVATLPPVTLSAILARMERSFEAVRVGDVERARGILLQMGQTQRPAGFADDAVATFERLVELAPTESYAWYELGLARRMQGDLLGAGEAFQQSSELAAAADFYDVHRPFAELQLGALASAAGDARAAVRHLEEARDSYRFEYLYDLLPMLAAAYQQVGNPQRALQVLEDEAALYDRVAVRLQLGDGYLVLDEFDAAGQQYARAAALFYGAGGDPTAEPVRVLAQRFRHLDEARGVGTTEGAAALGQLVTRLAGPVAGSVAESYYYSEAGQRTAAVQALARAAAAAPRDLNVQDAYAFELLLAGQYRETEAVARASIARDPRHHFAYLLLGDALRGQGRDDEALGTYLQSIEVLPGVAAGYLRLADLLDDAYLSQQALEYYRLAVEAEPANIEALEALARALEGSGMSSDARRIAGTAAELARAGG